MFLDNFPIYKNGKYKGEIDWKKSIGFNVKFIYDDINGEIKINNYDIKSQSLFLEYLDDDIFKIKTGSFKTCQLGKLLGIYTNKYKIEIETQFIDDKRNLTIIDREYRKNESNNQMCKFYKYKCNKCNGYGWIIEGQLLNGQGCSCCAGMTVIEGINDIPTTTPWMIPYFQGGYNEAKLYAKSSNKRIFPICPDCGRIKDKTIGVNNIYYKRSIGCSCSDGYSYPNKFMFILLEQLNINFEKEYSPEWIKPKLYDFYIEINNKKYIIEMDGNFHYKDNVMNNQTKEEAQYIDEYKDKIAQEHNIKVIRINCSESDLEYIKNNIINSELNNIFDLSKVNWFKIEEFALSNLVKKVCDIKKDNPNSTSTDISKIMKLSKKTISNYLKKGTELGWCNYNAKEELEKRNLNFGEKLSKKVICLETNIVYNSGRMAEQETKSHHISGCCNGKRKTGGGFHWMFYDDYLKQTVGNEVS